jgi:hypothetical protein
MPQGLGTGLVMGRLDGRGFFTEPFRRLIISLMVTLHAGQVLALVKDCSGFASIAERRPQIALQETDCNLPSKSQTNTDGFTMGYGGALTLVNGSPFDWVTSSTHSYQMDTWSWPTVNAGSLVNSLKPMENKNLTCDRQSLEGLR